MSCSCWILATMQASHKLGSQKPRASTVFFHFQRLFTSNPPAVFAPSSSSSAPPPCLPSIPTSDTPLKRKWTFNRAADIRGGRKMKGRRDTGITFSFSAFVRGV
ncbi:Hypothetical protein NocV09_05500190 [Nannochloropsis oceanica]